MSLIYTENTESRVIDIILHRPGLTVKEVHAEYTSRFGPISAQRIYRVISMLRQGNILVKEKNKYSLYLGWAENQINKYNSLIRKTIFHSDFFLSDEARISYSTSSLYEHIQIWSQLLIQIAKNSKNKKSFSFSKHAWYELFYEGRDTEFLKSFYNEIEQEFSIIGSKTFLDISLAKTFGIENEKYYLEKHLRIGKYDYCDSVGKFLIYSKLDRNISAEIDKIFNTYNSRKELPISEYLNLISKKSCNKIYLESNVKKAQNFQSKFNNFFHIK